MCADRTNPKEDLIILFVKTTKRDQDESWRKIKKLKLYRIIIAVGCVIKA